ncbi:MAG: sulfatase-like hydrolase/transferase, partial [Acidobacteria bacterium]|nr:sulfatase-like hydrolase/transferase [Acidobacteriota bacterium]
MSSSTRREFGKTVLGGAAALAGSSSAMGRGGKERPNIIFLLTDDQRWDQLSCMGHPVLRTPNMDRIAREGVMFRNMFVTTSLCSPSRASLLTGRYVHAHGVKDNKTDIAEAEMRHSYPYLLRQAGYQTAYIGKFHMGNHPQPHVGFDYWATLPGQGRYNDPEFNINGETKTLKGYSGSVSTDLALDFLKRRSDKPFCMALGFKEPHDPRTPPDHLKNLYSDAKV